MSTYADVRRRTAEKLSGPAKPANGQRPIKGCVIPTHVRDRLAVIRARCVAVTEAREAEDAAQREEGKQP
jgi:hypothetical protein